VLTACVTCSEFHDKQVTLKETHIWRKNGWITRIICYFCFLLWFSLYCTCTPTLHAMPCHAGYVHIFVISTGRTSWCRLYCLWCLSYDITCKKGVEELHNPQKVSSFFLNFDVCPPPPPVQTNVNKTDAKGFHKTFAERLRTCFTYLVRKDALIVPSCQCGCPSNHLLKQFRKRLKAWCRRSPSLGKSGNVNLFLSTPWRRMGGAEVWLLSYWTSALNGRKFYYCNFCSLKETSVRWLSEMYRNIDLFL
jgi:hypothetical protein